jgi:hypothetical protein
VGGGGERRAAMQGRSGKMGRRWRKNGDWGIEETEMVRLGCHVG